jgi:hypothetical protein
VLLKQVETLLLLHWMCTTRIPRAALTKILTSLLCIAQEPEAVSRKGLQVTKSLEASPPMEVGGLKGPC